MEALLEHLIRLLLAVGPWIVLVVTFAETAVFIGLLIPAEATVIVASVLAVQGEFSIRAVFLATFVGGFLGDQTGYLLGRFAGNKVVAREGLIANLWHKYEPVAAKLFRRQAALSVSIARFISFVRTLMPWFAGMSEMRYGRFLVYDFIGVLGWTAASVAVGYIAGESWRLVAAHLGVASAYLVAAIIGIVIIAKMLATWREKKEKRPGILRIALTGNIASGKSTVSKLWQSLGARIIDADLLARQAVAPGTRGYHDVVREFGPHVVSNGEIDRAELRALVFKDDRKRRKLEAIVHPEVARLRKLEEQKLANEGARVVVHDIPLLFEARLQNEFEIVVLVDAPEAVRIRRIVESRGLSEAEATLMVEAQMPSHEKRLPATYVIDNEGTLAELKDRATAVWNEIMERVQ